MPVLRADTALKLGSVCLLTLLLSACASQPRQGMYWGNYEHSLYRLADDPGPRASSQHLSNLRQVIQVSDARGWPPPPGAMLELAVLEADLGNTETAAHLVNREYHLYPESRVFIRRWFSNVLILPQLDTAPASTNDEYSPLDTTDIEVQGGS